MLLGEPSRTPYDLNFRAVWHSGARSPAVLAGGGDLWRQRGRRHQHFDVGGGRLLLDPASRIGPCVDDAIARISPMDCAVRHGRIDLVRPAGGFGIEAVRHAGQRPYHAAGPLHRIPVRRVVVAGFYVSGHGNHVRLAGPLGLWPRSGLLNARLSELLDDVFFICIFWGLVNLLPIYPLDGGQIARELFMRFSPRDGIRQSMLLSIFAAVAMAVYGYVRLNQPYIALLFGYLAYSSFIALQSYIGGSRW